jgi:hypothetical protein
MEQLLGSLPQLADLIQKGGVVGLLLIVCGVLVYEVRRLRNEQRQTYAERDAYRLHYTLYKSVCDAHDIKVDTSALQPLPNLLPGPA